MKIKITKKMKSKPNPIVLKINPANSTHNHMINPMIMIGIINLKKSIVPNTTRVKASII
jgi:hypothetical protein